VALVTESCFTAKHCDEDIEIDQYKLFRRDRVCRKGSGVCVYIRDHYTSDFPSCCESQSD